MFLSKIDNHLEIERNLGISNFSDGHQFLFNVDRSGDGGVDEELRRNT
jgi:hypothetical protein